MPYLRKKDNGIVLDIHVQPKAAKTRIAGLHDNALKLSVMAPPVAGKANDAVTAFFAKLFRLPKSSITIESGLQGRRKRLFIAELSEAQARKIFANQLDK
jgi:uncharacterized protein (TIGR00251 family)